MSKQAKPKPVAEKKFSIFSITAEGTTRKPKSVWPGQIFSDYYDSEEAAMQDVQRVQYLSDSLIIVPVIRWNHFPE